MLPADKGRSNQADHAYRDQDGANRLLANVVFYAVGKRHGHVTAPVIKLLRSFKSGLAGTAARIFQHVCHTLRNHVNLLWGQSLLVLVSFTTSPTTIAAAAARSWVWGRSIGPSAAGGRRPRLRRRGRSRR